MKLFAVSKKGSDIRTWFYNNNFEFEENQIFECEKIFLDPTTTGNDGINDSKYIIFIKNVGNFSQQFFNEYFIPLKKLRNKLRKYTEIPKLIQLRRLYIPKYNRRTRRKMEMYPRIRIQTI